MKHRIQLFLTSLGTLLICTFIGKVQFALVHQELHQSVGVVELIKTLFWGWRFDLAIATVFALLAYILATLANLPVKTKFTPLLTASTSMAIICLLLLHGSDTLYYAEAGRHMGYELKEGFNSGAALLISALTTYSLALAVQLALIVSAILLLRRFVRRLENYRPTTDRRIIEELAIIPIILLSVTMVRGGFQSTPLEPLHAQSINHPHLATLTLNGAYNAFYSSVRPYAVTPVLAQAPDKDELALLDQMYTPFPEPGVGGSQKNIVVILLESWSGTYLAPYGYERVTTPHFDKLRNEGFSTRAMLAGGSRTTEGMFSIFCSAQNPLGQTVAQSQLQNFDYNCLPEILRQKEWHTAFIQGTNKETSGTASFAHLLGFGETYGKRDISESQTQYEQNSWGFHDPDIYDFTLNELKKIPRPFLVGINTNTTHDSHLPEGIDTTSTGGDTDNRYLKTLRFADQALGDFITAVQHTQGLEDTLFVLVADHSGPTPPGPLKKHLIPFAIVGTDITQHTLDVAASQRDIAPTLLELLNLTIPNHFTGNALLSGAGSRQYSDYYHQGQLGWVEDDEIIEFPVTNPGKLRCFSLVEDVSRKDSRQCDERARSMQRRALAFTRISQSLLFSGELMRFAELR